MKPPKTMESPRYSDEELAPFLGPDYEKVQTKIAQIRAEISKITADLHQFDHAVDKPS